MLICIANLPCMRNAFYKGIDVHKDACERCICSLSCAIGLQGHMEQGSPTVEQARGAWQKDSCQHIGYAVHLYIYIYNLNQCVYISIYVHTHILWTDRVGGYKHKRAPSFSLLIFFHRTLEARAFGYTPFSLTTYVLRLNLISYYQLFKHVKEERAIGFVTIISMKPSKFIRNYIHRITFLRELSAVGINLTNDLSSCFIDIFR